MEMLPHSSSDVPAQFPILCVYLMSSNGSFVNNRRRRQCARAFAYVMAERRRSAHAIDDQNNGGRSQQENHVTRYLVIYLDQWSYLHNFLANFYYLDANYTVFVIS